MIDGKKILAVIPARGGSKGIKNKNIVKLQGKHLIGYTIEVCKESLYIDEYIVSTDSEDIKEVSELYGAKVPFYRPEHLASDSAKSIDVVLHVLDKVERNSGKYDIVVLLQPTSPLRTVEELDNAIVEFVKRGGESLVSVCECEKSPILMREILHGKLTEIVNFRGNNLRRQELPIYYMFNGAIYINTVNMLKNKNCFVDEDTIPFIMDRENSVDIDEEKDLIIAEYYLNKREGNK
ncbi:acylneuraminate cytidylyltransferase family protein [Oceanirhabdus sp. W0125-5]|uniref:acylneuraminate cytidylyltransferase family protein n=1 Tax=Oceanirhabdus sp. W0125-5 TaxID=2999116 RepID=UPI0022F33C2A|nr:acylneuraminate cytidylyltransferase family protein [Oceanirhabdus sp. W0125-5]WBW95441.1 acylneuraminate cytidylyltransferase family protein [Oceanirhabdus sp. W0125-5]